VKRIGVYEIKNIVNNKSYVGSSSNIDMRLKNHLCHLKRNIHANLHLQSSWNKYGSECFKFSTIELCNDNQLLDREEFWINKLNSINNGFNICPTPTRKVNTPETRLKISLANRGKTSNRKGVKLSRKTKIKIGQANRGRKWSLEDRLNLSSLKLGCKLSDRTKDKISRALSGKFVSSTTRKKISLSLKGCKNPNYGKIMDTDIKRRISNTLNGHSVPLQTRNKISKSLKKYYSKQKLRV
jgi:group I intron endonuclease